MSDYIPFDIQTEIIKRVPEVKSLLRFRSVSKSWKSFIDSSEFITGYGARDSQPHQLLLRYKDNVHPYEVRYVSFVDDENDILTQQQDFASSVSDLVNQLKYSTVIGNSCGLWCIHGYKNWPTEMVVIWNPTIRKSVGIVMPRVLSKIIGKMTYIGFGVCPSTYDPTIVVISSCFKWENKNNITWEVGIFTLSSKTWKMIPGSNVPRESIRLTSSTQVATNRFNFWAAYERIAANDKSFIFSFDLITHEFKDVNLPRSLENRLASNFSISKLSESLAVSAYTNQVNIHNLIPRNYGAWIMGEEGGVMTSFTKLFTITTPYVRKLLGFRMSGEPLMEVIVTWDRPITKIKVYRPCSKHINDLEIAGIYNSFFSCPYIKTLLLIDHSDGCIISNDYCDSKPTLM